MATFFILFQLLSITTISLFLRTSSSPLVDNVCIQTRDPPLCATSLGADERSESADLPMLAEISLDFAQQRGDAAKMKIHEYLLRATDPAVRALYAQCDGLYIDALDMLFRAAPGFLQQRRYGDLYQLTVRVHGLISTCEAAFNYDPPFKSDDHVVEVLVDAVGVIVKNL